MESVLAAKHQAAGVIIEACLLTGWVHDLYGELGVRCLVANTASEPGSSTPQTEEMPP